jgi:hypothetical protein
MTHQLSIEELRRHIRIGVDQADRGELIDGEAVFEELKALSETRRRLQKNSTQADTLSSFTTRPTSTHSDI